MRRLSRTGRRHDFPPKSYDMFMIGFMAFGNHLVLNKLYLGSNSRNIYWTAIVSKSVLKSLYDRKSPPGTIYYRKKSVKGLFTTDSEVIKQEITCSKGQNLLQGVYHVVIFVMARNV